MNFLSICHRWNGAILLSLSLLSCALFAPAAHSAEGVPTYNRDIRPILAENCFACHGQDKSARKADLRLDVREDAIKAGVLVPGKPEKSPLVERIFSTNDREIMPPPKSHKKLTAIQKDTLKRWVAAGAEYQPHWAFIAPKRPELPAVKKTGWAQSDRPLHSRGDGEARSGAGAGSRPADSGATAEP